jgi:hypothetical protein
VIDERNLPDLLANVLGYVPLGLVLARRGARSAIGYAAAVSAFAEFVQLFVAGRDATLMDFATNVLGAALGFALAQRWTVPDRLALGPRMGAFAGALALGCAALGAFVTPQQAERLLSATLAAPPWLDRNERGSGQPGRLEARWTFDTRRDGVVADASGHGLDARLVDNPVIAPGVSGGALRLNGVSQWLDAGRPSALRLTGSMTVSAWIDASWHPPDDAAIVSDYGEVGYQLGTTLDEGRRTLRFELTDEAGRSMERYGSTALATNRWYHVAGVYDAGARTIDVYVDGRLDNGCLCGTVAGRQHVSALDTFVGRRADQLGFEFAGGIDDVRIDSRALTAAEIAAVMRESGREPAAGTAEPHEARSGEHDPCPPDPADARLGGLVFAVGALVAVAVIGLWPPRGGWRVAAVASSFVAGILLAPVLAAVLPALLRWLMPVLTLAGGVIVEAGTRAATDRLEPGQL